MLNEMELLNCIKQGDTDKLNIIMDKYCDKMKKTAYLITGNDRISEDCVQEMFIRFYYNIDQFRGHSSLRTYLYKILVNECRQELRRSWYKKVILKELYSNEEERSDSHEEISLTSMGIRNSLLMLNKKYRVVLVLHYFNGMTVKEIGEALDTSQGTIKSRLKRAREALKPYLEKEGLRNEY